MVRIEGAVRKPQKFPFAKGLKVEDLVIMAGGFTENADKTHLQVARQLNDTNFKTISKIYDITLSEGVPTETIELEPNDIVTVRYQQGYTPQQIVKVEGEVSFPGFYAILPKKNVSLTL